MWWCSLCLPQSTSGFKIQAEKLISIKLSDKKASSIIKNLTDSMSINNCCLFGTTVPECPHLFAVACRSMLTQNVHFLWVTVCFYMKYDWVKLSTKASTYNNRLINLRGCPQSINICPFSYMLNEGRFHWMSIALYGNYTSLICSILCSHNLVQWEIMHF